MPSTGYIQVHAYTSNAQLPLQNVVISITAEDGTALSLRTTDRSGKIAAIELPVPELSAGQTPNTGVIPFASVNLHAQLPGYEQITIERLQVFPDTTTSHDLEMIPLAELPEKWNQNELFDTPPQNL